MEQLSAQFDPYEVPGTIAIGGVRARQRVVVRGIVSGLTFGYWAPGTRSLDATISDDTGSLTVSFLGRTEVAGVELGRAVAVAGTVLVHRSRLLIMNPHLWLQATDEPSDSHQPIELPAPRRVAIGVAS